MCIEWKDNTAAWEKLSNLKESFPMEVAEHATMAQTQDEPAFNWWVPHALNERDHVIAKVKSCCHKQTHKFDFEATKTVADALRIDKENGDN